MTKNILVCFFPVHSEKLIESRDGLSTSHQPSTCVMLLLHYMVKPHYQHNVYFITVRYASTVLAVIVCLPVHLSVTSWELYKGG